MKVTVREARIGHARFPIWWDLDWDQLEKTKLAVEVAFTRDGQEIVKTVEFDVWAALKDAFLLGKR